MKILQKLTAIFTAMILLSGSFPVFAAETDRIPEEIALPESAIESEDEAPAFHARIVFRTGYTVIGTFTDFTPDITRIETLYSLDEENWETCAEDWNLYGLDTDDESKLTALQNQPCLMNMHEPLKSYIEGEIDRFYLKLRITKENGLSYTTQSAAIERGGLQPIPEGTECRASFYSSIAVSESLPNAPYGYCKYGRYQITVSADATAEEISALLPDTLPVEVQLDCGSDFIAIGVVDCLVTWKPLSLPRLLAGESVTIPDAAEEIVVPAGTQISTPLGIFQLNEALTLDTLPSTDEVRLVLNICPEDKNLTGVLKEDRDGLKIALYQKPTGAASIQAYILTEGESKWSELPCPSLLEELNAQPSTENSGYGLILRKDQDPYQSYLAAEAAGETPAPFFISLKIQGGIYDGIELILSWPDNYEQLPDLPKVRGAEGNEGNAGSRNRDDSTADGQRPNLSQTPDNHQEEQLTVAAPTTNGILSVPNQFILVQRPNLSQIIPDTADTSAENLENSRSADPPGAQAAADLKDKEIVSTLPNGEITIRPAEKNDGPGLLLLAVVTTAIMAGCCIGKAKEYGLLFRITGKIRTMLRK